VSISWCHFHQHLRATFLYKVLPSAFLNLQFGFAIIWKINIGAKATQKMLVKLTTVP